MWITYINELITLQHIGVIFTIIGTLLLAISVKIKHQTGTGISFIKNGNVNVITSMPPNDGEDYVSPTMTFIVRKLFWGGLILIALGSLLQW